MTGALLEIRRLHAGYGAAGVLHGVDLTLQTGRMACILGRNGAGKTTLLRTLAGQGTVLQHGQIFFDGQPVTGWPAHRRARAGIAWVPQGREVFARLSVQDNLKAAAFGCAIANWQAALHAQYAAFPVLHEKRHTRAGALSGGQQQMLALARALVTQPRLLLLDEPSEGIQPSIVAQMAQSIDQIRAQQGIAVLVVEQNLDFVARLDAPCHILARGQFVFACPAAQICHDRALQQEFLGV